MVSLQKSEGQNYDSAHSSLSKRANFRAAWCSLGSNLITVYDQQSEQLDWIQGSTLENCIGYSWLEKLPNTNSLISLISHPYNSAKFDVVDIDSKKRLFSFDEIPSGISHGGDISLNQRRELAALISVENRIAYHLFDYNQLKIIKRAKWEAVHKAKIPGLDFDPEGGKIAIIDQEGRFSISDVDISRLLFTHVTKADDGFFNRCKWNPIADNPIIAIKFQRSSLHLVDPNKQTFLHRSPIALDLYSNWSMWMEWFNEGSLLACGSFRSTKIYDSRTGKIVRTINIDSDSEVISVRCSKDGRILCVTAFDNCVKFIDFSTGNMIYTSKDTDSSKNYYFLLGPHCNQNVSGQFVS